MDVVIRPRIDSDVEELDKLREEEEISKMFSWGEESLRVSDYRHSLDERYGFTILVNGECAGYIALEAPTPCRSTYSLWGKARKRPTAKRLATALRWG